MDFNSNTI